MSELFNDMILPNPGNTCAGHRTNQRRISHLLWVHYVLSFKRTAYVQVSAHLGSTAPQVSLASFLGFLSLLAGLCHHSCHQHYWCGHRQDHVSGPRGEKTPLGLYHSTAALPPPSESAEALIRGRPQFALDLG
jgi:hypothetical protein